jgi:hypothetical protein
MVKATLLFFAFLRRNSTSSTMINNTNGISHTSGAEVTHFDTVVAFVLPDQEFLFQRIQVFRHKDELLSGRILAFMILHGQAFFYPSVSTFIIASKTEKQLGCFMAAG